MEDKLSESQVCVFLRERERERKRQTEREREGQRERARERGRKTEREKGRESHTLPHCNILQHRKFYWRAKSE